MARQGAVRDQWRDALLSGMVNPMGISAGDATEAKPLTFSIDLTQGAQGRAAIAKCRLVGNRGVITFGHHLGQLAGRGGANTASAASRVHRRLRPQSHARSRSTAAFLLLTKRSDNCVLIAPRIFRRAKTHRALVTFAGDDDHVAGFCHLDRERNCLRAVVPPMPCVISSPARSNASARTPA